MQFFLQLPVMSLPQEALIRGVGMLQLFCCTQEDTQCETYEAFSGTQLVRWLREPTVTAQPPSGGTPFPLRSIQQWSEIEDYPAPTEQVELGLAYNYDFETKKVSTSLDELGISLRDLDSYLNVAEAISEAAAGDKLGGWPMWVQNVEYPSCPLCKGTMQMIFQLDFEDNVPHMFGDAGCAHITQCPEHPDVLAFAWACC